MKSYSFGKRSLRCLSECHPDLQKVANHAIKHGGMDFAVYCGHRNEADQNRAKAEGKSRLSFPHSKHNKFPSHAFDAAPYPIDWNDIERFKKLGEIMLASARAVGVQIRWGGDFNMDGDKTTRDAWDKPHFELI